MYDSMNPHPSPERSSPTRLSTSGHIRYCTKGDRVHLVIRCTVAINMPSIPIYIYMKSISRKKATAALLGKWNANKII